MAASFDSPAAAALATVLGDRNAHSSDGVRRNASPLWLNGSLTADEQTPSAPVSVNAPRRNALAIATATDRNYVEITGVMLRSLVANGRVFGDRIVVFGDGLRASHERDLRAAASPSEIDIRDITSIRHRIAHFRTTIYWPTATYVRLLAPDLLGDEDRLLYVDGDVIITRSLGSLRSLPLKPFCVAAVPEADDQAAKGNARLQRASQPYLNAGVLLIDVPLWRMRNLTDRLLSWLDAHPNQRAQDQDALNAVLGSDWLPLDHTYNSHCAGARASADAIRSATIIHFTGERKPTEQACMHPARDLFMAQRAHTPWGRQPLTSETRVALRRLWLKAARASRRQFSYFH